LIDVRMAKNAFSFSTLKGLNSFSFVAKLIAIVDSRFVDGN